MQNLSFWERETFVQEPDYLIIGSGIVGLSTAIYLKQREKGKNVTVIERSFLPSGASTKNAGFSCIGSPSELLDDLSQNSADSVFKTVAKRWKGLENLKQLVGREEIGFELLGSHELFAEEDEASYQQCIKKLTYFNEKLRDITGKPQVFSDQPKICKAYGFEGFKYAIASAAEGQIDTGKMMKSLIELARETGVKIFNGVQVKAIEKNELSTNCGPFKFGKLIICTNGFSKQFLPSEDIQPARAQVIITKEIPDLKLKGIFHFDKGYYYFRNVGNRVLFGGGRNLNFEGEKTEKIATTEEIISQLKQILKERILPYTTFDIDMEWAGIMGVGAKKEPIIQKVDDNIFCGVRLGGMGVAIGSLVGKELAELILTDS